ncbi:MAG: amidohydrolase [Acidimicrobiales bacterium]|nr:amidohydrolase [Acidimicrobiales bacterium]
MAAPLIIDTHAHAFNTSDDADLLVAGYAPLEYGDIAQPLAPPSDEGTIGGLLGAMTNAGVSRAILLHTWLGGLERLAHPDASEADHANKLALQNREVCETADANPELIPYVAVDLHNRDHAHTRRELEELKSLGARGVKIHPSLERVAVDDPEVADLWQACVDLGLPVVAHGGQTHDSHDHHGAPVRFTAVLKAHPTLRTVVAHLGGAEWRTVPALAAACPNVAFDICEIIQYVGAPHAPTPSELGQLISDIGSDRVLFGTDFPWYGLDDTIDRVLDIPGLSQDEKEAILGQNAARFLQL